MVTHSLCTVLQQQQQQHASMRRQPCTYAAETDAPSTSSGYSVVTRNLRVRLGKDNREVLKGVDLKVGQLQPRLHDVA